MAMNLRHSIDSGENSQGWLFRVAQILFLFSARFTRGMTLGVRGMVLDAQGRIFLVRHTYVKGWHMPGGGVSAGETLMEALVKELKEEGNLRLMQPAELVGVYCNRKASGRDHVAVFVVRDFVQDENKQPDREIAEAGFFSLKSLPEGTTQSTRRRIAEVLEGLPLSQEW